MKKMGTYLSGFGLVEVGAAAAGYELAFAVEFDPENPKLSGKIADTYILNLGDHLIRKSITEIDPADLPYVYWFHCSPVCKNFSQGKADGEETAADIAIAQACAAYFLHHRPAFVTVENVWLYRNSHSWRVIANALTAAGYQFNVEKINMADYGVPQTRERMIVIARLGALPPKLQPTHTEKPFTGSSLFADPLLPWNGWYGAIEDLIPSLVETEFARWQEERLPLALEQKGVLVDSKNPNQEYGKLHRLADEPALTDSRPSHWPTAFLVNTNQSGDLGEKIQIAEGQRPAFTVTGGSGGRLRAFLLMTANTNMGDKDMKPGRGVCWDDEPANTVAASNGGMPKAFLVDRNNQSRDYTVKSDSEPSPTVLSTWMRRPSNSPVAFLVDFGNTSRPATVLDGEQPSMTVQAWHGRRPSHMPGAFIVDCQNNGPAAKERGIDIRTDDEPAFTVTESQKKRPIRAWLGQGRVVKLDARCLARFQTLPDWYQLPPSNAVACAGIGNGVPSWFAYQLGELLKKAR